MDEDIEKGKLFALCSSKSTHVQVMPYRFPKIPFFDVTDNPPYHNTMSNMKLGNDLLQDDNDETGSETGSESVLPEVNKEEEQNSDEAPSAVIENVTEIPSEEVEARQPSGLSKVYL